MTLLVDGMNVIGARPDGWWRDRAGAARRLATRLQALAADAPHDPVVLVLDGPVLAGLPEGDHDGVTVVYARRTGPDAADDRIVELTGAHAAPVDVVTSDRRLRERVEALGARVSGTSSLLARLPT